jgi:FKBP-type peptidyl-prolyl cis-trans isomerase 2
MPTVKNGDSVKVHYTGKLADGTVFDTSEGNEPLAFIIGEGRVIEGFETAVVGMEPGETKTVHIPPEKAYGPHQDAMVIVIDRKDVPEDIDPEIDQVFSCATKTGRSLTSELPKFRKQA